MYNQLPGSGRQIKKSYIYFLYAPIAKRMKIGYSKFVEARVKRLQFVSPEHLELLRVIEGDGTLERMLHRMFVGERNHGEWFDASPKMVEFVKSLEDRRAYRDIFELLEKFRGSF